MLECPDFIEPDELAVTEETNAFAYGSSMNREVHALVLRPTHACVNNIMAPLRDWVRGRRPEQPCTAAVARPADARLPDGRNRACQYPAPLR